MALLRHPAQRVVASSLFTQGLLVLSGPIAVRLLGVEGRGELAFVFAGVIFVGQVAHAGLPQAWAYYVAQDRASVAALSRRDLPRFLARSVLFAVLGAVGLLLLADATTPLSSPAAEGAIVVAGIVAIMVTVLGLAALQGSSAFTPLAVVQAVPGFVYTVGLVVLLAIGHASLVTVLVLYFSGWALIAVLSMVIAARHSTGGPDELPPRSDLRSYGRRALVAAAAPIDNLGLDQLLVGGLLAHEGLGLYVVGLAFETAPVLILVSVGMVCMTGIANLDGPAERVRYARTWLVRGLAAGAVVVVGVQLVVGPVLPLAFGDDARPALGPARILVVAGLFLGLRRLTGAMLQGIGRPGTATTVECVGLVVMVVGMFGLTDRHGVEGACYAMLAGGLTASVLSTVLLFRAAATSPTTPASTPAPLASDGPPGPT